MAARGNGTGAKRSGRRAAALALGVLALGVGAARAGPGRLPDPLSLEPPGRKGMTPLRVELGKALFFDGRLSSSGAMSCASCHKPELGFADGQRVSSGVSGTAMKRHTPHLFNLAWSKTFFWDGRAASLEEQIRGPLSSPDELNMPMELLVLKLKAVPQYALAFDQAYPGAGLTAKTVASAIAAFVRTLVSGGAPFDRYLAGEQAALGPAARRGMDLFYGRAACSSCHSGPHLSDGKFHNTGVPGDDRGRAAFDRVGEFQVRPYPFFQTQKAFKTPGLRNVALTAPYFHDGSEPSLEDVVGFYNRGGKERDSYGLALDIRPLGLDERQLADLVAFLESLSSPVDVTTPVIPGQPEDSPAATAGQLGSTRIERGVP